MKQIDVKSSQDTGKAIYDSSIILFNDTAYRVNIRVFDREAEGETKANAILILKQTQNGRMLILTKDSIYTRNGGYVQFADFNNDGIKDLLVFYTDGARANPRFHLYLINTKLHRLIPVKGFEELTNAEFDSKNNIIISVGLSGSDYYSFYRITRKNKLINLGHSFEVRESHSNEHADSVRYNNAIKAILKDNKTE
ncbi:FG-GAP repeat domain-containing protein [Mucilaginibacter sp. McL0603]|uniref:FG-GAP repeat domain-containing protein n=1 Tax=Mucilaginibacter sp. McL0603 TaxID=3415670 RepID=UPI003CE69AB2